MNKTNQNQSQILFQNEMDQELRELMGKQVSHKTWVYKDSSYEVPSPEFLLQLLRRLKKEAT